MDILIDGRNQPGEKKARDVLREDSGGNGYTAKFPGKA